MQIFKTITSGEKNNILNKPLIKIWFKNKQLIEIQNSIVELYFVGIWNIAQKSKHDSTVTLKLLNYLF